MSGKKYIIGIDGGVNGGITILDSDGNIVAKTIMPVYGDGRKEYDIISIITFLAPYKEGLAILEKAQPQFRDGRVQAFKTGYGYGVLQAALTSLFISFQVVAPKIWQKYVFEGLPVKDTKAAGIAFCKRRWPKEDWTATKRSVKCHDGLTDSACIAYYGSRVL